MQLIADRFWAQTLKIFDLSKNMKSLKLRAVLTAFVIALTGGASASWATSDAWSDTINRAELAESSGNLTDAEHGLQKAVSLAAAPYAQYSTALLLARHYDDRHMNAQAEAEYKRCENLQNEYRYLEDSDLYGAFARFYQASGKDAEAQKKFALEKKVAARYPVEEAQSTYVSKVESEVKNHWHPAAPVKKSSSKKPLLTTCCWLIDKQGRFVSVHISKSSGDEGLDKAALSAIGSTPANPKVPAGKLICMAIEYTFEYRVPESK